jgi:hypothetical protein
VLGAWHEAARAEECDENRYRRIGLYVRDLDCRYLGLKSIQQEHAIGRRGAADRVTGLQPVDFAEYLVQHEFSSPDRPYQWTTNFPKTGKCYVT